MGLEWLIQNDHEEYQSLHPEVKSETDKASTQADDYLRGELPPRKLSILLQLLVVTLALALIVVSTLYIQLCTRTAVPSRLDCGESVEVALQKGCTFDQLMKTWLPQECPRYGLEEHLAAGFAAESDSGGQWRYYRDREATSLISTGELAKMADEDKNFFATGREHMSHCTWMLMRMAYVYNHPGMRKDFLVSNFAHAKHCILFLSDSALESPGVDKIQSTGNLGFGSC
ncbi:hypothetical protein BJ170DRAFT_682052 [Xylariales sp. AK1849]|nr:hypothetical protein BJ170DRAFT_682052 [Xylariales sp. AK1849]